MNGWLKQQFQTSSCFVDGGEDWLNKIVLTQRNFWGELHLFEFDNEES